MTRTNTVQRVWVYQDQFFNQIESTKQLDVGSIIVHNIHKSTQSMNNIKFWRVKEMKTHKNLVLVPVEMEHIASVARYHL